MISFLLCDLFLFIMTRIPIMIIASMTTGAAINNKMFFMVNHVSVLLEAIVWVNGGTQ